MCVLTLVACADPAPTSSVAPAAVVTVTPTPSSIPSATPTPTRKPTQTEPAPTATSTAEPSATATPTAPPTPTARPTLEPQRAAATIRDQLQAPACRAPCFWGITPGQTSLIEALGVFNHLGLAVFTTSQGDTRFFGADYKFEDGLAIEPVLAAQDNQIQSVTFAIEPEIAVKPKTPREWWAYSPETLIRQYGSPSRVELAGEGPLDEPGAKFAMYYELTLYFDAADLIVSYASMDGSVTLNTETHLVRVCPLTDQMKSVRMWFGKSPQRPPTALYPLETAASLTAPQFAGLMVGPADRTCFFVSMKYFEA